MQLGAGAQQPPPCAVEGAIEGRPCTLALGTALGTPLGTATSAAAVTATATATAAAAATVTAAEPLTGSAGGQSAASTSSTSRHRIQPPLVCIALPAFTTPRPLPATSCGAAATSTRTLISAPSAPSAFHRVRSPTSGNSLPIAATVPAATVAPARPVPADAASVSSTAHA